MIRPPEGWLAHPAGDRLLLHPADATAAVIDYRERVHPLVDAATAVERLFQGDPRFEAIAAGAPQPLVSCEGEHGALVTVACRFEGRPVQRDVGLLFGDDGYARTDCLTFDGRRFGEMTGIVRDLVTGDRLGLGVRRRRFGHEGPRGWLARDQGDEVTWLAPGSPDPPAAITVWRALPHRGCQADALRALVDEVSASGRFAAEHLAPAEPVDHRGGLDGWVWDFIGTTARGHRRMRTIAALEDDRYVYPARLDQALDERRRERRAEFLVMVATIQGIPAARASVAETTAAFGSWVD